MSKLGGQRCADKGRDLAALAAPLGGVHHDDEAVGAGRRRQGIQLVERPEHAERVSYSPWRCRRRRRGSWRLLVLFDLPLLQPRPPLVAHLRLVSCAIGELVRQLVIASFTDQTKSQRTLQELVQLAALLVCLLRLRSRRVNLEGLNCALKVVVITAAPTLGLRLPHRLVEGSRGARALSWQASLPTF